MDVSHQGSFLVPGILKAVSRRKRSDVLSNDPFHGNFFEQDNDAIWIVGVGVSAFVLILAVVLCCMCSRWTGYRRNRRGEWVADDSSPFYMAGEKLGGYDNVAFNEDDVSVWHPDTEVAIKMDTFSPDNREDSTAHSDSECDVQE